MLRLHSRGGFGGTLAVLLIFLFICYLIRMYRVFILGWHPYH